MASGVLELREDNFEQEILNSSTPVIVDFWAAWCMPCMMIGPIVEQIDKEYKNRCKVMKLNVDEAMGIATRFSVMNIPTIIFFKDGNEYTRIVGVVDKETIAEKINEMIS